LGEGCPIQPFTRSIRDLLLKVKSLVWVIIAIIWAASDQVGAGAFVTATTALTFGYLISRGIAKASRVLEQ
jgi:hypothetical protein